MAANGDALLTLLESGPKLVIVDLNARSQPIQVIERVRAGKNDVRVIQRFAPAAGSSSGRTIRAVTRRVAPGSPIRID